MGCRVPPSFTFPRGRRPQGMHAGCPGADPSFPGQRETRSRARRRRGRWDVGDAGRTLGSPAATRAACMQGLSGLGVSLAHTHTHLTPPVPLPPCGHFSGPPRPFSFPGFALTNGVGWYVRARALTPELRRGASFRTPRTGTGFGILCSGSQQGTSSHFCLSPSNLVARKSWGSWGKTR